MMTMMLIQHRQKGTQPPHPETLQLLTAIVKLLQASGHTGKRSHAVHEDRIAYLKKSSSGTTPPEKETLDNDDDAYTTSAKRNTTTTPGSTPVVDGNSQAVTGQRQYRQKKPRGPQGPYCLKKLSSGTTAPLCLSMARSHNDVDVDPDPKIRQLLTALDAAERKQHRLEQQLHNAGMVIAEDIPYAITKQKVHEITQRMVELHAEEHTTNNTTATMQHEHEYYLLSQEMQLTYKLMEPRRLIWRRCFFRKFINFATINNLYKFFSILLLALLESWRAWHFLNF